MPSTKPFFAILLAFTLMSVMPAMAEEAPAPADQAAVQQVITSQIEAFRAGDGDAAYAHAAPNIKQRFKSPSVFMKMVREGYAPVYSPQSFEFGPNAQRGDQIVQEVFLTAPDGSQALALYRLHLMEDGTWKISAVFLREMPDQLT